jgi:predicted RNA binding protein YcfA (HicA-like mRNA interferase family)
LFSNIYLHELDLYIQEIITKKNLGKEVKIKRAYSKEYRKVSYQVEKLSKLYKVQKTKEIKKQLLKALVVKRNTSRGQQIGEKAYYCRYADDFIIGVLGKKTTVESLKKDIENFLDKEGFNQCKTKVINVKHNFVNFLGFDISRNIRGERKLSHIIRKVNSGEKVSRFKMRVGNTKLKFYLPFGTIIQKLSQAGFMKPYQKGSGKIVPIAMNK